MTTQLKPGRWLGYSADTSDADARRLAARRLGCSPQDVEIMRDVIVKVRRREMDQLCDLRLADYTVLADVANSDATDDWTVMRGKDVQK